MVGYQLKLKVVCVGLLSAPPDLPSAFSHPVLCPRRLTSTNGLSWPLVSGGFGQWETLATDKTGRGESGGVLCQLSPCGSRGLCPSAAGVALSGDLFHTAVFSHSGDSSFPNSLGHTGERGSAVISPRVLWFLYAIPILCKTFFN